MSTEINIAGRVAVVTGAARGNGAAIAKGLAQAGATVAMADINADSLSAQCDALRADDLRVDGFTLDVSDQSACAAIASSIERRLGPVSILVNNAGILLRGPVSAPAAHEHWAKTLEVNVDGPFNVSLAFLDQLKQTRGAIVNVASTQAFVTTVDSLPYSVSKGAVVQLTRALATELARDGVRVNAIAPGIIATEMTAAVRNDQSRLATSLMHIPFGRVGQPEELVGPVLFLVSDLASYVTGIVLPIDGGYLTQ